jgi:hypothetical protein
MGYELDSEKLGRLQALYAEMSDRELFDLAARPEDLTDVAREVLRAEFASRRLDFPVDEPEGPPSSAGREAVPRSDAVTTPAAGFVVLITFHDAMAAGQACDALTAAGIDLDVQDVSEKSAAGGSFYGGPPVALQIGVLKRDRERAMAVLRTEMDLFPLQEVEEADPVVDDGTITTVGNFGRREDADEIAKVLEEAGIWHRVVANPEGSAETEDAYALTVREVDLMRAGDVVEKALG